MIPTRLVGTPRRATLIYLLTYTPPLGLAYPSNRGGLHHVRRLSQQVCPRCSRGHAIESNVLPGWISTSRFVASQVEVPIIIAHSLTQPQRRFICQITGHSGLSFFEALDSEVSRFVSYNISRALIVSPSSPAPKKSNKHSPKPSKDPSCDASNFKRYRGSTHWSIPYTMSSKQTTIPASTSPSLSTRSSIE